MNGGNLQGSLKYLSDTASSYSDIFNNLGDMGSMGTGAGGDGSRSGWN